MSAKQVDLLVLIFLVALVIFYSQITQGLLIGRPLVVSLLMAIPAVIYLGLRQKKQWPKIWVSTLTFGFLLGFFFEFIQEFNKSYSVVLRIFPKILGILPLDNVLGHSLMTLVTITFYQHFIRQQGSDQVSGRVKVFAYGVLSLAILEVLLFFLNPVRLRFAYPYLYFGLVAIIPVFILAFKRPELISNLVLVAPFFFFLYLVIEMMAVKSGWWVYPGNNYVGWVSLFGYNFPFEELFFWMLFYAPALISYYELLVEGSGSRGEYSS